MEKAHITNLRLMLDCEFYFRLVEAFSKVKDARIASFLSTLIIRECTVFIYAMFEHSPDISKEVLESSSKLFKESYETIRHKLHYFKNSKSNPFDYLSEKSNKENVLDGIQKHYLTRPIDDMYCLRHDVTNIKVDNTLYGSSIDLDILTYGTPIWKSGRIIKEAVGQYCVDLARIISSVR